MKKEISTQNCEETKALGAKLASCLKANMVLCLRGDLGAGKTTFTQGLGAGLGIKKVVNSPTFTIMKVYEDGRLPMYHIDAYRLEGLHQDLGFEEYIDGEGVCVIEWPMYVEELLPSERLEIALEYTTEDSRRITLEARGSKYEELLKEL